MKLNAYRHSGSYYLKNEGGWLIQLQKIEWVERKSRRVTTTTLGGVQSRMHRRSLEQERAVIWYIIWPCLRNWNWTTDERLQFNQRGVVRKIRKKKKQAYHFSTLEESPELSNNSPFWLFSESSNEMVELEGLHNIMLTFHFDSTWTKWFRYVNKSYILFNSFYVFYPICWIINKWCPVMENLQLWDTSWFFSFWALLQTFSITISISFYHVISTSSMPPPLFLYLLQNAYWGKPYI